MPISDYESDGYGSDGAFLNTKYDDILPSKKEGHSGNTYSVQEEKRKLHNALERKRRGNIKENFDQLFDVVPCDEQEKQSRAQILHSTVRHILKMNSLLAEEEKFKAKCENDLELLQQEIVRLEHLNAEGVEHPTVNPNILKIIQDAQTTPVPDYNNIQFNERVLDEMWQDENLITTNGAINYDMFSQDTPRNSSDARQKSRTKQYEEETPLKSHLSSSNSTTYQDMIMENVNTVVTIPTNDFEVIPNIHQITSIDSHNHSSINSNIILQNSIPATNTHYMSMLNMDNNYDLCAYTTGVSGSIASMVSIPSMVPINSANTTSYSTMPTLTPSNTLRSPQRTNGQYMSYQPGSNNTTDLP